MNDSSLLSGTIVASKSGRHSNCLVCYCLTVVSGVRRLYTWYDPRLLYHCYWKLTVSSKTYDINCVRGILFYYNGQEWILYCTMVQISSRNHLLGGYMPLCFLISRVYTICVSIISCNKVHTNNKNQVYESELKTSLRVIRWKHLSVEFDPETVYITVTKNLEARALSRLPKHRNIADGVEAILPFIPKEEGLFSSLTGQDLSNLSWRQNSKKETKGQSRILQKIRDWKCPNPYIHCQNIHSTPTTKEFTG